MPSCIWGWHEGGPTCHFYGLYLVYLLVTGAPLLKLDIKSRPSVRKKLIFEKKVSTLH